MIVGLEVPRSLQATFVVGSSGQGTDANALASALNDVADTHPVAVGLALKLMDRNLLQVREIEAPEPSDGSVAVWRHFGADDEKIAAFQPPSRVLVVECLAGIGSLPFHEWGARIMAGALAAGLVAPVLDVFAIRILTAGQVLASVPENGVPVIDTVVDVMASDRGSGKWMTTKGLGRFGLPELQIDDAPSDLARRCEQVLFGTAHALTRAWYGALQSRPVPETVELPDEFEVSADDIAAAHGQEPRVHQNSRVRLELDPGPPGRATMLSVLPPSDEDASVAGFWADTTRALCGELPIPAGQRSTPEGWRSALDRHFKRYFGSLDVTLAEKVPVAGLPSIDLCQHDGDLGGYRRLRTRGMSDLPTSAPADAGVPERAELIMYLPDSREFFTSDGTVDPDRWWAGKAFKQVALLPHLAGTWLSHGHTVTLSEDGRTPLHPSTLFTDVLLAFPLEDPGFLSFEYAGLTCGFLQVMFLTHAEAALFRAESWDGFERFGKSFNMYFEPGRACSVTGQRPHVLTAPTRAEKPSRRFRRDRGT